MIKDLDPTRWAVLNPYLDEALDLPDGARPEWLEGVRAQDSVLAGELEMLLAEHDRMIEEHFLEEAPLPRATLAGLTLGSYTLREQIGYGGMGSVWLSARSDGRYEGLAAVKLLNASLIGQGAEERFRREGSILARLRHRHIAHLIDAGISPAGQPYLVLEHVDGQHLDAYCDGRRLGIGARLRLFLDVLAAVSHAHANLIVHRDLKPSNVLVDQDGTVKLLDFGVAKLLAPDAAGPALALTRDGEAALTPEYAAPEQLLGRDITTAIDVYALGVLLYVLLSGRHPAGSALRSSPGELFRAVLEREPAALSAAAAAAVEDGGTGARERAAFRGTTPEALRRALQGDLETIVAKALKKAPAERYESVAAFAEDLRRYLAHEPIGARRDTLGYRTAKFVRRHRLPVALGGAGLLALAAGLAGTIWEARTAARQRDLALAEVDRAENINEFTGLLFAEGSAGRPTPVSDVLARAESLADKRSRHDPALAVDLLVNIGDIYVAREEIDNARRTLKRAYEMSQTLPDQAARARAACAWARAVAVGGAEQTGALRLIDEGLALTSSDPRFDNIVATCLLSRGSIGIYQGSARLVSLSGEEALRRLDRRPRAFPALRASALHAVAVGHRLAGETAEADRMFARAFEQFRLIGLEDSLNGTTVLSNWATNTALTSPLAALEQNRRVLGTTSGQSDGSVPLPRLLNYALQLSRLARHAEARAVLEQARTGAEQHDHGQGVSLANLRMAHSCRELGDLACAREALRAAEKGVPSAYPPGHRVQGDLVREQSLLAAAEGRGSEAHGLMLEALSIHQQLKDKNLTQIETLLELSRLELKLGKPESAEEHARAALAAAEGFRGGAPQSSWVGQSLLALGAARQAQGDAAGARDLLTRAIAHMTPTLGAAHPDVAEARRLLAQ